MDTGRSVKEICEILGISRNTYYKYTRSEEMPLAKLLSSSNSKSRENPITPSAKVMKVKWWLQVENNSKFVRGKGRVRNEI